MSWSSTQHQSSVRQYAASLKPSQLEPVNVSHEHDCARDLLRSAILGDTTIILYISTTPPYSSITFANILVDKHEVDAEVIHTTSAHLFKNEKKADIKKVV